LSLHQKGRQLNVVDINNEVFPETFSLHSEKHMLLENLSDYTFELKDCCKKIYSKLSTDINYINEKKNLI